MNKPIRKVFKGTICQTAIQCTCPDSGEVGTFLFTGASWRDKGSRVTPVFLDVYELCQWLRSSEFVPMGHDYIYEGN